MEQQGKQCHSLSGDGHIRDGEPSLCLVVPCGLLLLGHCNCSMELQWRLTMSIIECVILAGSSFASVFGALAGPRRRSPLSMSFL